MKKTLTSARLAIHPHLGTKQSWIKRKFQKLGCCRQVVIVDAEDYYHQRVVALKEIIKDEEQKASRGNAGCAFIVFSDLDVRN